ncbi:MAG: S8 family serine peptidase [Burkholderiales bacterium]|nr:S8 family serine peptidase [Burkholderiales bacterium]
MATARSAAKKAAKKVVRTAAKTMAAEVAAGPAAKKVVRAAAAAVEAVTSSVSTETVQHIGGLLQAARARRFLKESSVAPAVVVSPPQGATADSSEIQTVSALNLGRMADLMGGQVGNARMNIVRRLDRSLVITANAPALRAVRNSSPGLRIFHATYLYPQYLRPLGEELAELEIQQVPGATAKKFKVRLIDTAGAPVVGVKIRALLEWEGAHISAKTGQDGVAEFAVPQVYARVELLIVEPEHTYWSKYVEGFDRVAAPKVVDIAVAPLIPDAFALMGHYAPYDATAGQGVKVGVIDSGVGPHQDLTVSGGAGLVTEDDAADFLDNGIGHGTHVAGTIAGALSAAGLYGVAPACTLMSYRVCPKTGNKGRAQSVDVAAAIEKAISDGCDLVNISMGSVEAMPEVPEMLQKAREAGMVIFAATGNDGAELLRYPARYSHTQAVGALGRDATFPADSPEQFQRSEVVRGKEFVAEFSNYGLGADFIGPGVAVMSTFPGERYAMMSGTSMATPFTTGMAARLLSRAPNVLNMPKGPDRADAIIRLVSGSTRMPGWSDVYGSFGVVRA